MFGLNKSIYKLPGKLFLYILYTHCST